MAGDPLQSFYSRLGTFADPTNPLADLRGADAADATAVVSKIVKRYVDLSAYGEKLRQLLAANVKVPCQVWTAYAAARQDYLTRSQAVFDQLAAKAVTIEQVVYSNGAPQLDPADATKVVTLQIQAPLRPPAFTGLDAQCPGLPLMNGLSGATDGWQPVPVSLGAIDVSTAAMLGPTAANVTVLMSNGAIMGLASYDGAKAVKQIAVTWEDYTAPTQVLTTYAACVAAYVKRGRTILAAGNRCASNRLALWHWLGIGAGALVLGTIVLRVLRGPRALPPAAAPTAGYDDGVALGELYFRPRRRRRGR
jgi:hypothetical protein